MLVRRGRHRLRDRRPVHPGAVAGLRVDCSRSACAVTPAFVARRRRCAPCSAVRYGRVRKVALANEVVRKYQYPLHERTGRKGVINEMSRLVFSILDVYDRITDRMTRSAGQGLAEYALILALIAIVAIVALIFLGGQVSKILSTVGTKRLDGRRTRGRIVKSRRGDPPALRFPGRSGARSGRTRRDGGEEVPGFHQVGGREALGERGVDRAEQAGLLLRPALCQRQAAQPRRGPHPDADSMARPASFHRPAHGSSAEYCPERETKMGCDAERAVTRRARIEA